MRSGLAARQAVVEHQTAREAVLMDAKVGEHRPRRLGDAGTGDAMAAEMR